MILITVEIGMKNVILSFKIISTRSLLRNLKDTISLRDIKYYIKSSLNTSFNFILLSLNTLTILKLLKLQYLLIF